MKQSIVLASILCILSLAGCTTNSIQESRLADGTIIRAQLIQLESE